MKDEQNQDDELDNDQETDDEIEEDEDDEELSLDDEEEGSDDQDTDGEEGDQDEDDEDENFSEEDLKDPAKAAKALDLLKKSKSALKQKAIWKRRAMQSGYGKTENKKPVAKKAAQPKASEAVEEARQLNELTNFRLDHSDIPRKMVNEIQKYARANGVTMERALKTPIISRFVADKQMKEKLSNASPSSRHRGTHTAPAKDWTKATSAEVAAHEREVRERHLKK